MALLALPALFAAAAAVGLAASSPAGASGPSSSSGGGGGLYSNASTSHSKVAPAASGTALAVRRTSLGKILTDGRGFTVYAFAADKGTRSRCSGACATAWPPVPAKRIHVRVGSGVKQSLVGRTTRADGSKQLTYAGHPLYLFEGDRAPGNTNGQGSTAFGAKWNVLTASGKIVSG